MLKSRKVSIKHDCSMLKPTSDTSFSEAVHDFWGDLYDERNYTRATENVIYNIGLDADPDSWDLTGSCEGEECEDDFVSIYVVPLYKRVSTKNGLVEWLKSQEEGCFDIEGPELWDCGPNCKYKDMEEVIADTDIEFVLQSIKELWNEVCDQSNHKE